MSRSTQRRQANAANPFEIFARTSSGAYVDPSRTIGNACSALAPTLAPGKPAMRAISDFEPLALSQIRFPVPAKTLLRCLITGLLIFALLPSSVQKRCYTLLGWKLPSTQPGIPLPVDYAYISSHFGKRWGRPHQGIDFAAPHNAPIYAASAGKVIYSGWEADYGKSVVIDHGNNIKTRYAHCSKLLASVGQAVSKGTQIARVGSTGHSTGPHLHFEVIVNGIRKNPAWYYAFQPSTTERIAQALN